ARLPSAPIAYLDTAPSAKLVVKAYRSSLVTTAQQISLRPLPNERVAGVSEPPRTAYDEAAASPLPARNASVTIRVPPLVKPNPYGVGPDDGVTVISPSRPSAVTANVMIESVARSVMTSIEPSGVNPICAGSAFAADSGISAPMRGSSPVSVRRNPVTPGLPVFRTNTRPSRSATLFGAAPPDETV